MMFERLAVVFLAAVVAGACATSRPAPVAGAPVAPRFAAYPAPELPADLRVPDDLRARHEAAWVRLQAGDLRGAAREYSAVLNQAPDFYPARVGLGYVDLANGNYRDAEPRFAAGVAANDQYLPAWVGQAEVLVGLGRDADAIVALERVLALDPGREAVRTRLELLRFRLTQSSIGAGVQARADGRYGEAVLHFEHALAQAPGSTMILSELARTEIAAGRLDQAERHIRESMQLEPREADWQALMGEVLEARGQFADAAEAYARADLLEPDEALRVRGRELRERAEFEALPAEFRTIVAAATITRADVAAFVGIHLKELVAAAPVRATTVATDVRTHWAASWILPVTRAGIMPVFPNHTFQPGTAVRRGDLAGVMAVLVQMAAGPRSADLNGWEAARPQFADLPGSNLFYAPSALVTAAGVMAPDTNGRFEPTRPATGAELDQAVRRVAAIAGR